MKFNTNDLKHQNNNGVYKITNLINSKMYIGSTFNKNGGFIRRYYAYNIGYTSNINSRLKNSINKYGIENFEFSILEIVNTTVKECRSREEYYIEFYKTHINGYNIRSICSGGNGGANKGKKYPKPSKEVVARRALGISKSKKGVKFTKEHCEAMSKCRIGKNYNNHPDCTPITVKNFKTGEIISAVSFSELSRKIGCCVGQISSLFHGKSKTLDYTYILFFVE
jgi:group I intron endonuclease